MHSRYTSDEYLLTNIRGASRIFHIVDVNLIDQSTSTVPIGLTWMDTGLTLVF